MTRIIAGAIGSLQLKAAAKATRPTSDRVKESLFAKLDSMGVIEGASVLDLFAGTGALGLECASRGASRVELVEQDRAAFRFLEQNLSLAQSALSKQDLDIPLSGRNVAASKYLSGAIESFDLAFIDPPYDLSNEKLAELLEPLNAHLNEGALVIIERSSRDEKLEIAASFSELSCKVYGDTYVAIWEFSK